MDSVTTSVDNSKELECPFKGVASFSRVWRKVPESDAQSEKWGLSLVRTSFAKKRKQKTGEKFQKKQCQGCFPSSNLPYAWKCLHAADLDAVTIIVHSVAVCRMLLQLLFTLWPFAGCCYNCSLCGHLQDAVTIIVHSMAVCRILLWSFTLWLFVGYCYDHLLCGCL